MIYRHLHPAGAVVCSGFGTGLVQVSVVEKEHSDRSPSGETWWGNCPGAPAYVERLGAVRDSGEAAEWGTMCHRLAEVALNFVLGRSKVKPLFSDGDKPAKEVVESYVNALLSPEERLCECNPHSWLVGVEERGASPRLPHSDGTRDFVAHCEKHGWLRTVDLKTGHGEVEAIGNTQGAIYSLQSLLSGKSKVSRIIIEIVQPRSPSGRPVKRWHLTPLELLEMLPVFQRRVAASFAPDAPLVAGEKQCKYCPAAPVCPERRKGLTRAAMLQFGIGTIHPTCSVCGLDQRWTPSGMVCANGHGGAPSVPREKGYTPEDVAEALRLVPQVKDWVKSVESFAYQAANNGMVIPGYKLVQKRDGNREWKDEVVARNRLLDHVNEDQMFSSELKSPAQMEKIVPEEVVNELCKREPGGTVLVENSNERPAVVVDKLATFQHLLTK